MIREKKRKLVCSDSRERFDGHAFVDKAVENGAVATLWMKDVANPPENLPVIFVEDTLSALQMLAKTIAINWMLKL